MNKAFEKKLNHSIELLRKAERIALKYDRDDGFYLAFSGGKDSQALYHVAKMAGVKFEAHMSLTSVDPPQVIRFVKNVYPDVVLHKPKMSIYQRAVERGILPTMRVRWCCADFKESAGAGKVTLIGIRKEESARRAKRHEVEVSDRKFGGNLEEFEAWSKTQIEKQQNKSKRKINEDEFSVKADNEVRCINGKDSILISPIFDWSEKDVWYFLNEVTKVPHCSLYDEGHTRIGCILCPMASYKTKLRDIKRFPHVKRNWIEAIKKIRRGGYSKKALYGGISQQIGCVHCNEERDSERKLPSNHGKTTMGQQTHSITSEHKRCAIFSDSPTSGGVDVGQFTEDEIAEAIFDWWISGKPYKQWYAEKYLQQQINFDFNDETTIGEENNGMEQG